MGKIILPDEQGNLPSTFADDSYGDLLVSRVTVLAQFPDHVDMTWHIALLTQLKKREVKYRTFVNARPSLPSDLVRTVYRGLRKALIVISDDQEFHREITSVFENIAGKNMLQMEPHLRDYFGQMASNYADEMVLLHSPLSRIETYLGRAGEIADLTRYQKTLDNPRNIRVFACRAAGAFFEILDPDTRAKAIRELEEYRYFFADRFESTLMLAAGTPRRVYDRGNQLVTTVIRGLRQEVHNRIESSEYLLLPPTHGLVEEADSKRVQEVGASDIAAGYARELYESSDGWKEVADAFDRVILNGRILKS